MFACVYTCMQTLAVNMPWSELRLSLEVMFEGTEGAGTLPVVGTSPRRAVSVGRAMIKMR